jgi:hypothetical protein
VAHEPGMLGGAPQIVLLGGPLSPQIAHDQWIEIHLAHLPFDVVSFDVKILHLKL